MRIRTKEAVLLFLTLFLIPITSAALGISNLNNIYNMGDDFNVSITISPSKDTSNFFTATLICGGQGSEIYRSPYRISGGSQKEALISTSLDSFLVSGMQGDCFLRAEFGDEQVVSKTFRIESSIDVTFNLDGVAFDPGDSVRASGQAYKKTGEPLNGFAEITIPDLAFSFFTEVKDGKFSTNLTIPGNSFSGTYEVRARAYEKDFSGIVINEGTATSTIRIRQIVKELDIALGEQEVEPGSELTYRVVIYDQAGEFIEKDVPVTIYKPDSSVFGKNLVNTGANGTVSIKTETNSTPGYWKIEATLEELKAEKEFFVKEVETVSFILEGQTLIATNTGNIPYNGPVEISIGSVKEIKEISDLPPGESKRYKLLAPDGNYDISISDGSNQRTLGSAFLTGKAISVKDIGGTLTDNLPILIGLIVILVLAIVGLYLYRRISKTKSLGKLPGESGTLKSKSAVPESRKQQVSSLIDKGEKQESEIVSLKIKNAEALQNKSSLAAIDSALWKAKEARAKIYSDGDYRVIVFAPILTKEKDNSIKAVTTAQTIERVLNEHNKRAAQKIIFGIAAHSGNLIVESHQGKFRFISVNNVIAAAKRISQNSSSELIISEPLHRKTVGKIKTLKLPNQNFWKVLKVTDRSAHKEFISKFTERQKQKK